MNSEEKPERIDSVLVRLGLARSRQQAQELVRLELVFYRGKPVKKPSQLVLVNAAELEVKAHPLTEYVSRGSLKLKGAIERVKLDVTGFSVLDVGISTGGFADYLLKAGADSVLGIEVGHSQLAESLKQEARVTVLENFNARNLSKEELLTRKLKTKFDLVVIDVSFISLELILPRCVDLLKEQGAILALVKPQFEVGLKGLGKGGIVRDSRLFTEIEEKIRGICKNLGLRIEDYFVSSIEGSDGNKEFFIYAKN